MKRRAFLTGLVTVLTGCSAVGGGPPEQVEGDGEVRVVTKTITVTPDPTPTQTAVETPTAASTDAPAQTATDAPTTASTPSPTPTPTVDMETYLGAIEAAYADVGDGDVLTDVDASDSFNVGDINSEVSAAQDALARVSDSERRSEYDARIGLIVQLAEAQERLSEGFERYGAIRDAVDDEDRFDLRDAINQFEAKWRQCRAELRDVIDDGGDDEYPEKVEQMEREVDTMKATVPAAESIITPLETYSEAQSLKRNGENYTATAHDAKEQFRDASDDVEAVLDEDFMAESYEPELESLSDRLIELSQDAGDL